MPNYTYEKGRLTDTTRMWAWKNLRHKLPANTHGVMVHEDGLPYLLVALNGYFEPHGIPPGSKSGKFDFMTVRHPNDWVGNDAVIDECYDYIFNTIGWNSVSSTHHSIGCGIREKSLGALVKLIEDHFTSVGGWVVHTSEDKKTGWFSLDKADRPVRSI